MAQQGSYASAQSYTQQGQAQGQAVDTGWDTMCHVSSMLPPQPHNDCALQGPNLSVRYEFIEAHNNVGYADRMGYEGYASQFGAETKGVVELEGTGRQGAELCSMLYTYRSISRALSQPHLANRSQERAMYGASYEVLYPAVAKLGELLMFKERAVAMFVSNLSLIMRCEAKPVGIFTIPTPPPAPSLPQPSKSLLRVPIPARGVGGCCADHVGSEFTRRIANRLRVRRARCGSRLSGSSDEDGLAPMQGSDTHICSLSTPGKS